MKWRGRFGVFDDDGVRRALRWETAWWADIRTAVVVMEECSGDASRGDAGMWGCSAAVGMWGCSAAQWRGFDDAAMCLQWVFHFYFDFLFYFFISFSKHFIFVRLVAFHTTAAKRIFSVFHGGPFQNFNFHTFLQKNGLYQGVMGFKCMFHPEGSLGNITPGQ